MAWLGPVLVPALLAAPLLRLPAGGTAAAAVLVLLATIWASRRRPSSRWSGLCFFLLAGLLALGWGSLRPLPPPLPQPLPELLVRGRARRAEGGMIVDRLRFHWNGGWHAVGGRFLWQDGREQAGEFLGRAYLVGLERPRLPGQTDRSLRRRRAGLRGRLLVGPRWRVPGGSPAAAERARVGVRAWLAGRFGRTVADPFRSLAARIVWGERTEIDPALARLFRSTGTMHLLAVSGLHISLFAFLLEFLLRLLLRPARLRLVLLLAALAGYVWLVGARPSVVRAAVMAACLLTGRAVGRRGSLGTWWWLALLVVACLAPAQLLSPGGQLSFAATAALILRPPWRRSAPLVATLFACAATAGIQWAHFGAVAPVALLANLTAIPALGPVLVTLLWGLAWGDPAGETLQAIAWGPARLFTEAWLRPLGALVPFGEATMLHLSPGEGAGLAGSVGLLLVLAVLRRIGTRAASRAALLAALLLPWPAAWLPSHLAARTAGDLEAVVLAIGQGDAVLLRTREGNAYLVDTGPGGRDGERGRRRLAPALRALGVSRLRGLFLTHGDEDHIGGLRGLLLAGIRVDTLYVTKGDETRLRLPHDRLPPLRRLAHPWSRRDGPLTIRLLAPRLPARPTPGNEGSLVLRIEGPGGSLLLPGDLGRWGEEGLLADGNLPPADVLLAGHHGSSGSSGPRWLDALDPRLVVISCGVRNRHGHPAPELLERLARDSVRVRRTDRDGTIRLRWQADRLAYRCYGCSPWRPVL